MAEPAWTPGNPVDWDHPGELWTAGGFHSFVVETTGARTGELRRSILGYLEEGPDAWLVIGSKGGALTNPGWVHNLAAHAAATRRFSRWDPCSGPRRAHRRRRSRPRVEAARRRGARVPRVPIQDGSGNPDHPPGALTAALRRLPPALPPVRAPRSPAPPTGRTARPRHSTATAPLHHGFLVRCAPHDHKQDCRLPLLIISSLTVACGAHLIR